MDLIPHPNGIDALLGGPCTAGNAYRYNAVSDTWTLLGPHQLNSGDWWVGITVPEYGVTVWLCQNTSVDPPFVRVFKPYVIHNNPALGTFKRTMQPAPVYRTT